MEVKVDVLPEFVAFCEQEKTTAEAVLRSFMRDVLAVYKKRGLACGGSRVTKGGLYNSAAELSLRRQNAISVS